MVTDKVDIIIESSLKHMEICTWEILI